MGWLGNGGERRHHGEFLLDEENRSWRGCGRRGTSLSHGLKARRYKEYGWKRTQLYRKREGRGEWKMLSRAFLEDQAGCQSSREADVLRIYDPGEGGHVQFSDFLVCPLLSLPSTLTLSYLSVPASDPWCVSNRSSASSSTSPASGTSASERQSERDAGTIDEHHVMCRDSRIYSLDLVSKRGSAVQAIQDHLLNRRFSCISRTIQRQRCRQQDRTSTAEERLEAQARGSTTTRRPLKESSESFKGLRATTISLPDCRRHDNNIIACRNPVISF